MKIVKSFNKSDKKEIGSGQFSVNWNNAIALTEKADKLLKENKSEEAMDFYERAIKECNTYNLSYLKKAALLVSMNKIIDAIEVSDQLLRVNKRSSEAWYNKGILFYEIGKKQKALEAFNEFLEIEPCSGEVLGKRGEILLDMGKNSIAIESFEKALKLDFDYKDKIFNNLGLAYLNILAFEKALEVFEKAQEINPKEEIYRENIDLALSEIENSKKNTGIEKDMVYLILMLIIGVIFIYYCINLIIESINNVK